MADTVKVELGGKSKYEVAEYMAREILYSLEKKSTATRVEYLTTISQCMTVLSGGFPSELSK